LGVAVYLLPACTPVGMITIVFKQNPGRFDRQALEVIVAQVRRAELKLGERREFVVDRVRGAESLHAFKPDQSLSRGHGAGHVWAQMSADNTLKVVIETRDLGHAGEYGFAYSEVPLSPAPSGKGGNWCTIDVPGHLTFVTPAMKIDDHWWKVAYNLD
jgi:hypothetical protein